eukprot:14898195-Alexandrium_andersonii.AAC.1
MRDFHGKEASATRFQGRGHLGSHANEHETFDKHLRCALKRKHHASTHARARASVPALSKARSPSARTQQGTVTQCPHSPRHGHPVPAFSKARSPEE